MDVQEIICVVILIYLIKGNIFISRVKFKAGLKGVEFDLCTKEKNGTPRKDDRSDLD